MSCCTEFATISSLSPVRYIRTKKHRPESEPRRRDYWFYSLSGLECLIGAQVAGKVEAANSPAEVAKYGDLVTETEAELKKVNEQIEEAETEELTAQKESLEKKKGEYRMEQLKAMEWKSLWMFPAIFAAGVLGIFLLLFRDKTGTGAEAEAK